MFEIEQNNKIILKTTNDSDKASKKTILFEYYLLDKLSKE